MQHALQILFSLRDAVELQRAVFQSLWRCACDRRWRSSRMQLVDAILHIFNRDALEEAGCRAFCMLLLLRHCLRQQAASKAPLHLSNWLDQADLQEHALFVEVILRFAIAHSSDKTVMAEKIPADPNHCPFAPLEDAWGIATQADEPVRSVHAFWLLQYPEFWKRAISIAERRAQQLPPEIMAPVRNGLTFLASKVEEQELTVREIMSSPPAAWENPVLVELLEGAQGVASLPKLGPQLKTMIKKVQFMRRFEKVLDDLRVVIPTHARVKVLASILHRYFLAATTHQVFENWPPLAQLDVALVQIDGRRVARAIGHDS